MFIWLNHTFAEYIFMLIILILVNLKTLSWETNVQSDQIFLRI